MALPYEVIYWWHRLFSLPVSSTHWYSLFPIAASILDKESIQLLLSDTSLHIRLWNISTYRPGNIHDLIEFDEKIKTILLEVRSLEINSVVTLTRERTTFFFVTYAQMLGILASPNSWLLLDLVSWPTNDNVFQFLMLTYIFYGILINFVILIH